MREDPWEFEHFQVRANRHVKSWLRYVVDDHLVDEDWRPPVQREKCPQCDGTGASSLYLGAFTSEQMSEDPDFADDYWRGGYDRTCETCEGRNVVEIIDDRMLPEDLRESFLEWMADAYQDDAIQRAEWRMGA